MQLLLMLLNLWLSERSNFTILEKYSQPTTIEIEQPPSGKMVIDVYGQHIEPICNYRTCYHNFSIHGQSTQCKYRHAPNYAAGVLFRSDCTAYD
jgi:hypothetical protein